MEKIYLVLDIVFMIGLFCLIADIMKTNKATREAKEIETKALKIALGNKSVNVKTLNVYNPGIVELPKSCSINIETENYYHTSEKSKRIF